MRKRTIGIILAAVLVAGGLGGFAYATNTEREPMTGQKLVGQGMCAEWTVGGIDYYSTTSFMFTNPDCVSEITIERVCVFAYNGTVVYDEYGKDALLPLSDETEMSELMGPHETRCIQLGEYVSDWWGASDQTEADMLFTVEIFWSGSHPQGLPLIGLGVGAVVMRDGGVVVGMELGGSSPMVNMEQKLKP